MTVVSVGLGQIVSTLRWMFVDSIHHRTGIREPIWNFSELTTSVAAFNQLIEIHYRYYQWHANALVAVNLAAVLRWAAYGVSAAQLYLVIGLSVVLFVGSRDTLRKYYRRVEELL